MPVIIQRQDWPLWLGEVDGNPATLLRAAPMRDEDEVSIDDEIAIEQLAEELWQKGTGGTAADWSTPSVIKKQGWRNRARMVVAGWRKEVGQP